MAQLWCFTQGMQMCSRALWHLAASDFPTQEVFAMISMSGYVAGFTNVHAAAQRHLCKEFFLGDVEKISRTPSCRARFLLLGHAAVFLLMDGRYAVNFSEDICVQLFKDWCCTPSGVAAIEQLSSPSSACCYPLEQVFHLLPALQSLPAFSPVMDAAHTQLLDKFGDVSAIIASPALLGDFMCLPPNAVVSLFRNDRLVVDSEATVLQLLHFWLGANTCTRDERTQLLSSIRYSRLPSAYLVGLGEHTNCGLLHAEAMEVTNFLLTGIHTVRHYSRDWFKPKRDVPPSSSPLQLTLVLSKEEVSSLVGSRGSKALPFVYSSGFLWRLRIKAGSDASVWLCVDVEGVTSLASLQQGIAFHSGVVCDYKLGLGEVAKPFSITEAVKGHVLGSLSSRLLSRAASSPAPTEPYWWEEYASDSGRITFSAVISNINP
ncbi:MAG: hypothetical protein WDW38_004479 [Sanguina aurantia]